MELYKNILGQTKIIECLQSQLKFNKTTHAYLFCGPAGCGKLNVAKWLATQLLGLKYQKQIQNNTMPDVKVYKPCGVQTYLFDQIKEIVNDSVLAPILANKKIYIIEDAQLLGRTCANAFLKTLEEPSQKTCFILLANSVNNVLPTISSRCQILKFNQILYNQAIQFVVKETGVSLDDAKRSLEIYGGNTKAAINFCLDQNLQDFVSEVDNLASNLGNLTDFETLERCKDIVNKIDEITQNYADRLNQKVKDLSDVLQPQALKEIQEQNKREITSKKKEALHLMCSCLKLRYKNMLKNPKYVDKCVCRINLISEIERNLAYNINQQIFCDVVFLKLKRA